MTAPEANSAASDNSVFQSPEERVNTPADDPALVQIIEYAYETAGTTTRRDLIIETQWNPSKLDKLLNRLKAEGYVVLISESSTPIVLLTSRGEFVARREQ